MADHSYHELLTAKVEILLRDWETAMAKADAAVAAVASGPDVKKSGDPGSFQVAGENLVRSAVRGLEKFADGVMDDSLHEVPVDTATLGNSAAQFAPVREGKRIVVEFGYGYGDEINPKTGRMAAQYALPVHEIYDAEHEAPTKSHFLIDPLMERARFFATDIAAAIKATETFFRSRGRSISLESHAGYADVRNVTFGGGSAIRGGDPSNRGRFSGRARI